MDDKMPLVEANGKDDYVKDERAARLKAQNVCGLGLVTFAVNAALKLGVAEIFLNAGPDGMLSTDEIAKLISTSTGKPADADVLERILRLLASNDIIKESVVARKPGQPGTIEKRYGGCAVLKYLIDDDRLRKESFGPFVAMNLDSRFTSLFGRWPDYVLDKNEDSAVSVHGKPYFEWLSSEPYMGKLFHRTMTKYSSVYMPLVLENYDGFKGVNTLVDVGGGLGTCISAIVSKYPHIRGINFDQPQVVSAAPEFPGVECVGGNFFESVPKCDAVFMKWILHDWDDERCVKILKNIAKALPEDGKVINVDAVVPETSEHTISERVTLSFDLAMMTVGSGKERTLAQFRQIGAKSGFSRVVVAASIDNLRVLEFYK